MATASATLFGLHQNVFFIYIEPQETKNRDTKRKEMHRWNNP